MTTGDASGYVVTGAGIARSGSQQSSGSYAMSVDPANSAAGEGFYWTTPVVAVHKLPQHLTAQIEHRGHSASGSVKLEIRSADGTTVLATSGDSSLATSWVRLTASYTVPGDTAGAAYRVYMTTVAQHNISFYVDKLMFEVREDTNAVSEYIDGNLGIGYEWSSTTNASSSYRRMGMTTMRGIQIRNESGTSAEVVFVALDCTATATTGIPVIAGQVFESIWPIDFRSHVSVISASGTPTVSGVIWGLHNG